jgi:hypothetical protein
MEVDDAHVRHEHASVGRRTGVPWGHEVNMRSTKPITSAPFPLHVGELGSDPIAVVRGIVGSRRQEEAAM